MVQAEQDKTGLVSDVIEAQLQQAKINELIDKLCGSFIRELKSLKKRVKALEDKE